MIKREVFLYMRKTEPAKKKNQKVWFEESYYGKPNYIPDLLYRFLKSFKFFITRSHYLIQINNLGFLPWKNYLSWPYHLFVLHSSCSRNSFSKVVQIHFENNIRKQLASRPGDYSIDYDFCLLNLQWFSDFVFVILLLDWNYFWYWSS